jgi:ribonuclease HIII
VDNVEKRNRVAEVDTRTNHICTLDREQVKQLKVYLQDKGYEFRDAKYAYYGASNKDVSLTCYRNGKLLVQGKGTADFVRYYLEPQLLKEVKFGYEYLLNEELSLEDRIGVDESGKGDYFGPLVVAGLYADRSDLKTLFDLKVKDSKAMSDARVLKLTPILCSKFKHSVVIIGPEKYNVLYEKMSNLNKMLAWGHARVIENLLSSVVCKKVIIDKFADKSAVRNALMKKGRKVELDQRVRGESDIVVAAASVIARGKFLQRLQELSEEFKIELPKGASKKVVEVGTEFVTQRGIQQLPKVAKLHFKTTQKIMGV